MGSSETLLAEIIANELEGANPTSSDKILFENIDTDSVASEARNDLSILAVTGATNEYLGKNLSPKDVHKMSDAEVLRLHQRYQIVLGKKVTSNLSTGFLRIACKITSHVLSAFGTKLDDEQALLTDLQEDDLVKQELSHGAGWIALRGGRFIALAAALSHVATHIQSVEVNQQSDSNSSES